MKSGTIKKTIALLLCALLFCASLTACGLVGGGTDEPADESGGSQKSAANESGDSVSQVSYSNTDFELNFQPGASLNPITGTDSRNMLAACLIYEPLFTLSDSFEPVNVLCESFTTADGLTYDFKLVPGVTFHDGSPLTASDVAFTYTFAKRLSTYASRLRYMDSVWAVDDLTLRVVLTRANYNLPLLLDIPVIKSGEIDSTVPNGTGPYIYSAVSKTEGLLSAYSGYRADLPLERIKLTAVEQKDVNNAFSTRTLDLLQYDPSADDASSVRADHELFYYGTTTLNYIGFNFNTFSGADRNIRLAVSYAIDRTAIITDAFSGHASGSASVFSPRCSFYSASMDGGVEYSTKKLSAMLSAAGMDDFDGDGFLEYPYSDSWREMPVIFIVNEDSHSKVKAAEAIAAALGDVGVDVELRVLPWAEYIEALEKGDFNMYYGEVKLQADFDLGALLTEGGSLNYGGIADSAYPGLIDAFLASTGEARKAAALELAIHVRDNAHIIPILYKENAVAVHRNEITGLKVNQSDLFYNFSDWTIDLG